MPTDLLPGLTLIVLEESTEPLVDDDFPGSSRSVALDPLIAETLMCALFVVMSDELGDGAVQ